MSHKLMRLLSVIWAGFFMAAVPAFAEPTTAPMQITAQAPLPAATANSPQRPSPRVEVFPFRAISGTSTVQDWIGRGIQENLQSDVSRTGATLVMPAQAPAANEDDLAVAKQNHADLAVTGSYQIVGDQIRANGHLVDVATNASVGGFAATGSQQDLFKVEDALGEQLRSLLPGQLTASQIQQAFNEPEPAVVDQEPDYIAPPATINNYYDTTPVTPYYAPDYGNYDDYPYNYGLYGGFGFIAPGYGFGHRDYDHGHDGFGHDFGGRGFSGAHFGASPAFHGGFGGGMHSNFGGFRGGHVGGGHR